MALYRPLARDPDKAAATQSAYDRMRQEVQMLEERARGDRGRYDQERFSPGSHSFGVSSVFTDRMQTSEAAAQRARNRLRELQAARNAANPSEQQIADDRIEAATYGRGDAAENDPRLAAALDRIQGVVEGRDNSLYSQLTDANAAQAGAQADTMREQFARAGIGMDDPAAQARFRQLETARMQGNNAALGQQAQMANSAAGQLAQMRLAQMQTANQAYAQGAGMEANKVRGQQFVPSGGAVSVPAPTQPARSPQNQAVQPWQAPQNTQTAPTSPGQPTTPKPVSQIPLNKWGLWGTPSNKPSPIGPVLPNGAFDSSGSYPRRQPGPPIQNTFIDEYGDEYGVA